MRKQQKKTDRVKVRLSSIDPCEMWTKITGGVSEIQNSDNEEEETLVEEVGMSSEEQAARACFYEDFRREYPTSHTSEEHIDPCRVGLFIHCLLRAEFGRRTGKISTTQEIFKDLLLKRIERKAQEKGIDFEAEDLDLIINMLKTHGFLVSNKSEISITNKLMKKLHAVYGWIVP